MIELEIYLKLQLINLIKYYSIIKSAPQMFYLKNQINFVKFAPLPNGSVGLAL